MTQNYSYSEKDYLKAVKRVSDCFNVSECQSFAIKCGLKALAGKDGRLEGVAVHNPSFEIEGENISGSVSGLSWDFSSPKLNPLKLELWEDAQSEIKKFDKESFDAAILEAAKKNIPHRETFMGFVKEIAIDHNLSPTTDVIKTIAEKIRVATRKFQSVAA